MIKTNITGKISLSRIQYLELLYWNLIIKILSIWQELSQPAAKIKANSHNRILPVIRLEYILIAAGGLALGLFMGLLGI